MAKIIKKRQKVPDLSVLPSGCIVYFINLTIFVGFPMNTQTQYNMATSIRSYVTPKIRVLDVENELDFCLSGGGLDNPGDYDNGGDPFDLS